MDSSFRSPESGRGIARPGFSECAQRGRWRTAWMLACLVVGMWGLCESTPAAQAAYWPLDEGTGTTTADISGNTQTGTLTNSPVWATGKIGNALTFNGTNQYVTAGTPANLANLQTTGMTVMAWIKPNTAGGGGGLGRIVDKGNTTSNNGWWFTFLNSTQIRLQLATYGSPVAFRNSTAVITMGSWQHVAATWDGSKNGTGMHIYVNGVLQDDATQNATGAAQDDSAIALAIGNRASDGARGFDGGIDDVRIYNSVLTSTQIQAIANDSQPPSAPSSPSAAAASTSQINLSWTASTDNVAVTSYLVERCQGSSCTNFAQIAAPTSTTYNDAGLTASTTYRYRIRATDAVGLFSAYSTIVSATTTAGGAAVPGSSAYWAFDDASGSSAVERVVAAAGLSEGSPAFLPASCR